MSDLKFEPPSLEDRIAEEVAGDELRRSHALSWAEGQRAQDEVFHREMGRGHGHGAARGSAAGSASGTASGGLPHMHNPTPDFSGLGDALMDAYHWIAD